MRNIHERHTGGIIKSKQYNGMGGPPIPLAPVQLIIYHSPRLNCSLYTEGCRSPTNVLVTAEDRLGKPTLLMSAGSP